ncbi:MAG TPA: trigger factor [Tepidisphaeraceae bacterium]|nr:trigger factor [Tepidisphaeraceae bacterium]
MADQEQAGDTATEEQDFQYAVKVEDLGPGTKKVSVEIPEDRIKSVLEDQFKDLRREAAIPGFRPGHAPRKLIEKRFASDVKDQVRRTLISESYEQALEKNSLNVIGEPDFEDPDKIQLPDAGALSFSFTVEVQPEFTIPDLAGVKVKKPRIEIKDENVDQALANLREQQGNLAPVEDRGVEPKDFLLADVTVKSEGNVVAQQHDSQIVARAGRVAGVQVDDLDKQLAGLKPGESRTLTLTAPDTHPSEQLRGKSLEVEIALKDLKKLELAEIDDAFLEELGFTNEAELRDALREQMSERINYDVAEAMRNQVRQYLLDNIKFELPSKLSAKQTDRVVQRRYVDLLMRGMPREQIDANVERLGAGAADEASRELKLFFILQKLSADQGVDVDEAELNGRIAMLAVQKGRRPEKLKAEMAKDGSLSNLYLQLREQKALDKVIEGAQVEEVDMSAQQAQDAAAPGAEKTE